MPERRTLCHRTDRQCAQPIRSIALTAFARRRWCVVRRRSAYVIVHAAAAAAEEELLRVALRAGARRLFGIVRLEDALAVGRRVRANVQRTAQHIDADN